jgi:copper transport protein
MRRFDALSRLARRAPVWAALRLVVLAAGLLAGADPARAHAVLVGSEPAAEAVLAAPPARVMLRFNEPVRVLRLVLASPDGATAELAAASTGDGEVEIPLPALQTPGSQVLSWRVVSADGHPVGGTLVFAVGAHGGAARLGEADRTLAIALWLARGLMFAAALLAAGGAAFRAFVGPAAPRPMLVTGGLLVGGLLACVAVPGLHGLDLLGQALGGIVGVAPWRAGWASPVAAQAGLAALALLLSCVQGLRAAACAVLAMGAAAASTGHAATAAPQWLMRPALALHGAALAIWLGSLLPLLALARGGGNELADALRRYAVVVAPAFLVLLASGLALAVVQLGSADALAATRYGAILAAKLALAVLIAALALHHRVVLTPMFVRAPAATARRLTTGIRIELVLALAVLGLVMAWRFTPPPRALALAEPLHIHLHDIPAMADLTLRPGHAGANAVAIVLQGPSGAALDAAEVVLRVALPERGIEAIEQPARRGADGVWRIDQLSLPLGGPWAVELVILVGRYDQIVLADQIDLPP